MNKTATLCLKRLHVRAVALNFAFYIIFKASKCLLRLFDELAQLVWHDFLKE